MRPKNPRRPAAPLLFDEGDFVAWPHELAVRIHRTSGDHPMPWNGFREFGPVGARWDPHPLPPGLSPAYAVAYISRDLKTAAAEVFQESRRIDWFTDDPHLTVWSPPAELRLLDVRGDWAIRNGASASLHAATRSTCRNWAHGIVEQRPDIPGLIYRSTMTGEDCAVLFRSASSFFPELPQVSRPLAHPWVAGAVRIAAEEIGYSF